MGYTAFEIIFGAILAGGTIAIFKHIVFVEVRLRRKKDFGLELRKLSSPRLRR